MVFRVLKSQTGARNGLIACFLGDQRRRGHDQFFCPNSGACGNVCKNPERIGSDPLPFKKKKPEANFRTKRRRSFWKKFNVMKFGRICKNVNDSWVSIGNGEVINCLICLQLILPYAWQSSDAIDRARQEGYQNEKTLTLHLTCTQKGVGMKHVSTMANWSYLPTEFFQSSQNWHVGNETKLASPLCFTDWPRVSDSRCVHERNATSQCPYNHNMAARNGRSASAANKVRIGTPP